MRSGQRGERSLAARRNPASRNRILRRVRDVRSRHQVLIGIAARCADLEVTAVGSKNRSRASAARSSSLRRGSVGPRRSVAWAMNGHVEDATSRSPPLGSSASRSLVVTKPPNTRLAEEASRGRACSRQRPPFASAQDASSGRRAVQTWATVGRRVGVLPAAVDFVTGTSAGVSHLATSCRGSSCARRRRPGDKSTPARGWRITR